MPAHSRRPGEAGRGGRGIRAQVGGIGPAAVGGARPAGGRAARPVGGRTASRGGARSRGERAESAADGQHGARVQAGRQVAAAQRPVPRVRGGRVGRRQWSTAVVVVVTATAATDTAGGLGAAPAGARRQTGAPFLRARRPGRHAVPARIAPDFPVVAQADVRIPAGNDVVGRRRVPVRAVAGRAGRRRTGTGVGQASRHAGAVRQDRGARAQADDDDRRRPGATLAGNRRRRETSTGRSAVGSAAHGGGRPTVPGPDTGADGRGHRRGGARADRFAETVVRDVCRVRRQESATAVRFVAGHGNRGPAGASVFRVVRPVGRDRRPGRPAADAGAAGRDNRGPRSSTRHRCPRRGRVVLARRPRAPHERRAPRSGHRAPSGRLPESGGPSAVGRRSEKRFGHGATAAARRQARDIGSDKARRPAAATRDDDRFIDVAVVAAKVLQLLRRCHYRIHSGRSYRAGYDAMSSVYWNDTVRVTL